MKRLIEKKSQVRNMMKSQLIKSVTIDWDRIGEESCLWNAAGDYILIEIISLAYSTLFSFELPFVPESIPLVPEDLILWRNIVE